MNNTWYSHKLNAFLINSDSLTFDWNFETFYFILIKFTYVIFSISLLHVYVSSFPSLIKYLKQAIYEVKRGLLWPMDLQAQSPRSSDPINLELWKRPLYRCGESPHQSQWPHLNPKRQIMHYRPLSGDTPNNLRTLYKSLTPKYLLLPNKASLGIIRTHPFKQSHITLFLCSFITSFCVKCYPGYHLK